MNGVELRCHQGSRNMGLPFGLSGNVEDINESLRGREGAPKAPWTMLARGPSSSNSFHKMLAGLSYEQHLKDDRGVSSHAIFPPSQPASFSRFPDRRVNPIPYAGTTWVQQLQGTLPTEARNVYSPTSKLEDPIRHYPPPMTVNAGSLVLDTARGELVNASKMTPKEILEAKALAASKSHSEAERRRRERINSHLGTLRSLLPSSTKTDKASLLAEVIDQVKLLKRQVSEIYGHGIPTDHDELSVERDPTSGEGRVVMKVSMCCDDRTDLMADLRQALDMLKLQTLKAEISTLGGRVRNVFMVKWKEDKAGEDEDISMKRVQEALRVVMEKSGGGDVSPGSCSNKRQRVGSVDDEAAGCSL